MDSDRLKSVELAVSSCIDEMTILNVSFPLSMHKVPLSLALFPGPGRSLLHTNVCVACVHVPCLEFFCRFALSRRTVQAAHNQVREEVTCNMHDPASVQPYDIPTVLYISNTITHYTTIKNVKKRTVTVTKTKTQKTRQEDDDDDRHDSPSVNKHTQ